MVIAPFPNIYSGATQVVFQSKASEFEFVYTICLLIVQKNNPRNPWPMKTYAFGSKGPNLTFNLEFMNRNKNWAMADESPNTIAYTGLLMQAVELKIATPAPNNDRVTDLNPNRTQPKNTPNKAAEDMASTTDITLVLIVCEVCSKQFQRVRSGNRAQQMRVPRRDSMAVGRLDQLL